jgi:hypothetical protein
MTASCPPKKRRRTQSDVELSINEPSLEGIRARDQSLTIQVIGITKIIA